MNTQYTAPRAVGVSGSPSPNARSRILLARALEHLRGQGVGGALIDLLDLSADALLARRQEAAVDEAVRRTSEAAIIVLATPIYRASYTGQLKAFFDLFPQDALRGRVVGLIATGAGPGHLLAIDHGLRPLVASLRGLSAAHAVYVVDAQFPDKTQIPPAVDAQLGELADELVALARAYADRTDKETTA